MGIFLVTPPPSLSGYFAGKCFILLGLAVAGGCKILWIKDLAAKYCTEMTYLVRE
jgi:hypothetical protein